MSARGSAARAALVALAVALAAPASAQAPPAARTMPPPSLTFSTYLSRVGQSNLELAAQRGNLPIAEAQIAMAKIFPDPVLSVGIPSWDVSNVGAQNNVGASLTVPVEWPAKRRARIAVARAGTEVVSAELQEFGNTLRATASNAFIDALLARQVLLRRRQALESLERLVAANEARQREGAIGELVVLQSRLEARRYRGDLIAAEGDVRAAMTILAGHMGIRDGGAPVVEGQLEGALRIAPRTFSADALIAHALASRPELKARKEAVRAAEARVELARANRGVDVALTFGWIYYTPGAMGSAFQAPAYHTLNAMLSVPLPFSRLLNGELRGAQSLREQATTQKSAAELRVAAEIRAALARYEAARERLAQYDAALLADSDRLLEMSRYAFEQGASRLIELLSAQRTWMDTYIAYETALADHARALVALETAANSWDLRF